MQYQAPATQEQTDLSRYDNSWYNTGAPAWKRLLWYFCNVLFLKNNWNPSSALKIQLLKLFGAKIAEGVVIKPGVNIKYPWNLEIGAYSWIGEHVWLDSLVRIRIGANCCLSQGALILTGNHHYKKTTFDLIVQEVVLEDGVWIGAKAVVCPGVICHSHSILTVQSVATTNLSSYHIHQGNPAQAIRERQFLE